MRLLDDLDNDPGVGVERGRAVVEDPDVEQVGVADFVVELGGSAEYAVLLQTEEVAFVAGNEVEGVRDGVGDGIGIRYGEF